MSEWNSLYDAILTGDDKTATAVTEEALEKGAEPLELVNQYMVPAMDEVGKRFEEEEYFIPEMLLSARAMERSLALIQPRLAASGAKPIGRVAIGTVKGDQHDIGKNLVRSMLQGGGFEVYDLGMDVPHEKFIEAIQEKDVNIVCLSTLLTTTMPSMKTIIDNIQQAGLRDRVKVMVGGAPITPEFADQIGADCYGDSAYSAVKLARNLISA
ncbi:MAG: corrinoid protein [Candidatus Omnitrophica bacterium]|nr:corrinoid protein [Candidatus Omnitrophota bacterium]